MTDAGTLSPSARPAVPVLVLGKGMTALGVVRVLGRRGVSLFVAGAGQDIVTRSRWYRPLPGGPLGRGGNLAERLASLDLERMVLLPCSDGWAMAVSLLPEELRRRFPASVAQTARLERFVDKGRFAETLAELEIPHPRTVRLSTPEALDETTDEWLGQSFLKPTDSGRFSAEYGIKAIRPRSREHAASVVAGARAKGLELMLQEFIPGPPTQHLFLDGFVDRQGRVCAMFARRRLRMFPAEFGNSTYTESIPLAEAVPADATLRRLLSGIGYRGVFSAELKRDARDGVFKLLEVNARPWWFVEFAAACGVDVCEMSRRDALEEDVAPVSEYLVGRRCVYARRDLASRHGNHAGVLQILASWVGARHLTFTWDDPRPGLEEVSEWARRKLRR
jgi:predicted ATP-grasp superfamily ATP-dependent carboligase